VFNLSSPLSPGLYVWGIGGLFKTLCATRLEDIMPDKKFTYYARIENAFLRLYPDKVGDFVREYRDMENSYIFGYLHSEIINSALWLNDNVYVWAEPCSPA
jgi:hypothetical protein